MDLIHYGHVDPNALSAKAGEFVEEMLAFGGAGKVIKVANGVSIFGMARDGGFGGSCYGRSS